jgi:PAS domain S-box-containing protein
MNAIHVIVALIYAFATTTAFFVAGYLWQNKGNRGAIPLIATNISVGAWIGLLFTATVTPAPINEIAAKALYLPLSTSVASIFLFALEYTGKEEYVTRKTAVLLSIHPIIGVVLAFVNPGELYIAMSEPTTIGIQEQWGVLFWIHATYSYGLIISAALIMLKFFFRNEKHIYKGQTILILLAIISGISLNAVYLLGGIVFNTSAIGTVIAMVLFTVAIVKYDLTNITPVAREKIVEHIRDGIVITDNDNKIVNVNGQAETILGITSDMIGENIIEKAENGFDEKYEKVISNVSNEEVIEYRNQHLRVQHEVMENNRGSDIGRLLIFEDITQRVEREEEMRRKNEQLDQFASTIAHDLRNPLSAAKGFLNTGLDEDNEEMLKEAQKQHERMQEMIEDILDLSKAGNEVSNTDEMKLKETVKQGWKHAETDTNELELLFDNTVTLKGDKTRVLQIFENLFRNAQEHNTDPVTVTVGLINNEKEQENSATENRSGIFIADNGTGIDATKREKVFEHGHTTNKDGTGFGLSIIKDIIEAHGWSVKITSSESGGAQFNIKNINSLKNKKVNDE